MSLCHVRLKSCDVTSGARQTPVNTSLEQANYVPEYAYYVLLGEINMEISSIYLSKLKHVLISGVSLIKKIKAVCTTQ